MIYLLIASLVWAFSFGLIKTYLVGVDSNVVAAIRLGLSLLVFLPFLRLRRMSARMIIYLLLLGTVQYGLMYIYYLCSYSYLAAHQVALFTIFTPVYVTLINDLLSRRFHRVFLLTALLAVAGTGVIVYTGQDVRGALTGFGLMQVSNLCFAFGQVRYRALMKKHATGSDQDVFALMYAGAFILTAVMAVVSRGGTMPEISGRQWLVLLYLGVIPSGICFFFWNLGARRVSAGSLAVFNNAKIPLAVLASIIVFGERPAALPLVIGAAAIAGALWINARKREGQLKQ